MGQEMDANNAISCMNIFCHCTNLYQCMTGWPLKGGAFARLCFICGLAYANSYFCQTFHKEEAGWRDCRLCGKAIHCGCIASKHMYEYLDLGGIWCKTCQVKDAEHRALVSIISGTNSIPNRIASSTNDPQLSSMANNENNTAFDKGKNVTSQEPCPHCSQTERSSISSPIRQLALIANDGIDHRSGSFASSSNGPQPTPIAINADNTVFSKDIVEYSQRINTVSSTRGITREENTQMTGQVHEKYIQNATFMQNCPPSLAKHLPKVSDEELQQIFAALNSHVTPLFEKVLSASDVGRVGRLILPKICAVTYFPPLTEPAGVQISLLDSNGKTWNFQLRYWNNSSSRMYVFEGVHRYIREMGLQARDTVILGLIYPNQIVIGFKKIPRDAQECELTLRQAQVLLQPNPESTRNVYMIEGHEFEEFDEPPIIGNMAEFTTPAPRPSNPAPVKRVLNELGSAQPDDQTSIT